MKSLKDAFEQYSYTIGLQKCRNNTNFQQTSNGLIDSYRLVVFSNKKNGTTVEFRTGFVGKIRNRRLSVERLYYAIEWFAGLEYGVWNCVHFVEFKMRHRFNDPVKKLTERSPFDS